MPTRVLLLRHAETATPLIFHGAESDVALSPRGLRQAETIAEVLAAERPDAVVSSAMQRARATAEPIARACGVSLRIEAELHERRVGALCGTPTQGSDGVWPNTLRRWMAGDTAFAPEGAESFDDIRHRVTPVWQRVTEAFAGQTLVVVAHGGVIKVLLCTLLAGYSASDWNKIGSIRNVAINELLFACEQWQAVRLNELPAKVASF